MSDDIRARAIALYDRFTHEGMGRRAFMAELTRIAGSAAAANALLLGIAASPAAAAVTREDDKRLIIRRRGSIAVPGGSLLGYFVAPRGGSRGRGTVMVVHENRGLNRHIEDVTRRLALAGFTAVAPDFLTSVGGTPADEDAARAAIGTLDLAAVTAQGVAALDRLRVVTRGNGRVGAIGFCWGGAFVNRLAVAAGPKLAAGVSYYGPAPAPAEAAKVEAPLLIHLAGNDARVNATGEPWIAALKAAGKTVEGHVYSGVEHAFNNDTSAERYDRAAADLAWERTLAFFRRHLATPERR